MAQIIVRSVGAAIGGFLGGPQGAMIGWSIGGALSGALSSKNTQAPAAPLIDLKVTGTEYGQAIPYLRGAVAVAGQVWWNTDRRPTTSTTTTSSGGGKGGSGGQEVTTSNTTYDMDMLIGLCDNQIIGISRIWNNGKLIWTAAATATSGSVASSAVTDQWARLTVYTGEPTQLPDPTYEAAVGHAPAYRGRGTIFIQGLRLGSSGQVPNLTFEVVIDGRIVQYEEVLLYGPKVETNAYVYNGGIPSGAVSQPLFALEWNFPVVLGTTIDNRGRIMWTQDITGGDWVLRCVDLEANSVLETYTLAGGAKSVPIAMDTIGSMWSHNYAGGATNAGLWRYDPNGNANLFTLDSTFAPSSNGQFDSSGNLWVSDTGFGVMYIIFGLNTGSLTGHIGSFSPGPALNGCDACINAGAYSGRLYTRTVTNFGNLGIGWFNTANGVFTKVITATGSQQPPACIDGAGFIYTSNGPASGIQDRLDKYSIDGALLSSIVIAGMTSASNLLLDASGHLSVQCVVAGVAKILIIDTATWTLLSSFILPAGHTLLSTCSYGQTSALTYSAAAGAFNVWFVPTIQLVAKIAPSVANVVSDVCVRAGLTTGQIDVTGLTTITRVVNCFTWSQISSARGPLETLMSVYFFEMTVSDKIYFRPRGGAAVLTIPYADLGASLDSTQSDPLPLKQANELEIPAQVALTYSNISDDYQQDTQYSDRLITATPGTISTISIQMGLTPDEAKAVADTMALDQIASIISTSISLLGTYSALEPTDVVLLVGADGSVFRMRLVKQTDSYPLLKYDAILDDTSVLTSQGITNTDYSNSTVVAAGVNSMMQLLDIPILQDLDDDAGFYAVAKGNSTPYPGTGVYNSVDNVAYERKATILENAEFGTCTSILGNYSGSRVFDERNTVTVDLSLGAVLSTTTRDALLESFTLNAMLVGSEVIQFKTATLVTDGVYILSGLLRGCRGTEWAMTGHAALERCVLLQAPGMRRVLMQNNELGLSRYYKGVTVGRPVSSATAVTFTDGAVGLKPFSPILFRGGYTAGNDFIMKWQRRTRYAVRMIGTLGISAPLGEATESYEIDIFSDNTYTTVLRTISSTAETATYTAAQQVADGLTPGDPRYAKLYQMSEIIGRGYPMIKAA